MFCQRRKIHYISDEVYGLTSFASNDIHDRAPFVPAMSLDVPSLGGDLSRVHTIWSTSKDFGQSGVRMVRIALERLQGKADQYIRAVRSPRLIGKWLPDSL